MDADVSEALRIAMKPYDVISYQGAVGYIEEVDINQCQDELQHQLSYSVNWLVKCSHKSAWFNHGELKYECNLFQKIAVSSCHPMGNNKKWVKELMK